MSDYTLTPPESPLGRRVKSIKAIPRRACSHNVNTNIDVIAYGVDHWFKCKTCGEEGLRGSWVYSHSKKCLEIYTSKTECCIYECVDHRADSHTYWECKVCCSSVLYDPFTLGDYTFMCLCCGERGMYTVQGREHPLKCMGRWGTQLPAYYEETLLDLCDKYEPKAAFERIHGRNCKNTI